MSYAIAIDGPAAAGKSTVAKMIAKEKGIVYIDTGAMYRAIALFFLRRGIPVDCSEMVDELLPGVEVYIEYLEDEKRQVVYLNGDDVSNKIRTEEVSAAASTVSANPKVRTKLVEIQQKLAERIDVVMDGRDIATVVLPNADLKIFMTADAEVRAKRRYDELCQKGVDCTLESVLEDMKIRDYNDSHREHSPLMKTAESIEIDTTNMTLDEVRDKVISLM